MRLSRLSFSHSDTAARLAIVLLLSFGLGAATLLYTALDRLLVNPLGVAHPETLVRAVYNRPPLMAWKWFQYRAYLAMKPMRGLEKIAVEGDIETAVTAHGVTRPVIAEMVSGDYFSLLGSTAEVGRELSRAGEAEAAGSVPVVLSHRLWVSEFAGASSVLGSSLSLQGVPFTIVGVMPERFIGTQLDSLPDMWIPLAAQPLLSQKPLTDRESDRSFSIIARLRSGVTVDQAQAEFAGVYRAVAVADGETDPRITGLIQPIAQGAFAQHDQFSHAITLLLWGLAMLLLMTCCNVSGLMLVKATKAEKETAIRLALGASRIHLIAIALLDSMVLGLCGAGGGLLVAWACAPALMSLLPPGLAQLPVSLVPSARLDAKAVLLALGVSLVFGVFPAWMASRIAPQQALRRGTATRRTGKLGRLMLVVQTGSSLVLLVGTGLLLRTFYVLEHTNPGFEVNHLIAFTVDPRMEGGSKQLPPTLPAELKRGIEALPGVRNASLAGFALMQRVGIKMSITLPGEKVAPEAFLNTSENAVSSTFFETLGMHIVSGSNFSDGDANRGPIPPIVINEAFARTIFPHEDPLGKMIGTGATGKIANPIGRVVGVVGDSKYRSLREALLAIFYVPYARQSGEGDPFYLYVRTDGPPPDMINAARRVLSSLDPQLPFSKIYTMRDQLSESLWQERLLAVLAGVFSVISILMAGMGLYALLAYDANLRTREFGIRSAVGAPKRDLVNLLMKGLLRIIVPGVAIGLATCVFLTRIMASALYGIKPLDPISLGGALLIIATVGLVSACQPMRHAIGVDPAVVLREE